VNTVFFDVKDLESDRQRNLKTLPVIFGKRMTIYLLHLINLIALIPLIVGVYSNDIPKESLVLLVFTLYSFYYLTQALFLDGKILRTLSYVIADAEYILWSILIIIVKAIF